MTVPTDQLADWVAAWAARYPDPNMEDKFLAPFKKKETFSSDDMTALINSKFRAMAHRKDKCDTWIDDDHAGAPR